MEPTFTRQDLKNAIPDRCFRPDTARSFAYLFFVVALIALG
jgi:omega-3 fatty acid desaturase (delta-15 desaturase)